MLEIIIASSLVLLSGMTAGSYAMPTKYMSKWQYENIWTMFSLFAFCILPWLFTLIVEPRVFTVYSHMPISQLLIMIIGGLTFGIGQILFTVSLGIIGMGLAFAINLGMGTSLGFLLPLIFQHADKIFTSFGVITISGVVIAVIGLAIFAYAGNLRDKDKKLNATTENNTENKNKKGSLKLGFILVSLAGFASAGQNFSFSLTYETQQLALSLGINKLVAGNILWPIFLFCTFLTFTAFTLYHNWKNKTFHLYKDPQAKKCYLYAFIMAFCWYCPLIFYSKASQLFENIGPLIFWPIFMVLIILTSNFWGWKHKEWENVSKKTAKIALVGLILLISAIFILGFGSFCNL